MTTLRKLPIQSPTAVKNVSHQSVTIVNKDVRLSSAAVLTVLRVRDTLGSFKVGQVVRPAMPGVHPP